MTIERLLDRNGRPVTPATPKPEGVALELWLGLLEGERDWLLMRLRQIEPILVEHGRLRRETPRRIR